MSKNLVFENYAANSTSRYFEDVRRAVFDRLGRLSNDELGGDEDTVVSIVKHLGVVLPVVLRDFYVRRLLLFWRGRGRGGHFFCSLGLTT